MRNLKCSLQHSEWDSDFQRPHKLKSEIFKLIWFRSKRRNSTLNYRWILMIKQNHFSHWKAKERKLHRPSPTQREWIAWMRLSTIAISMGFWYQSGDNKWLPISKFVELELQRMTQRLKRVVWNETADIGTVSKARTEFVILSKCRNEKQASKILIQDWHSKTSYCFGNSNKW